jgi:hypothetical protein
MSIFNHFRDIKLGEDQDRALSKIEAFLNSQQQVFMLKGYAGSGKTTILGGLIEYFTEIQKGYVLMAPTGRAAKIIREKTGVDANTVHKSIYSFDDLIEIDEGGSFVYSYKIRNNSDVVGKVFIVDEASLLSDKKNEAEFFRFGTGHLLTDLLKFTRVCEPNVNSKIIFVGDPCQLPPIGENSSKAFDVDYLRSKFNLISDEVELKEVKRQIFDSSLLQSAVKIRKSISTNFFHDFDLLPNELDIFSPSHDSFLDVWAKAQNPKIIIASKNKTCLGINRQIRERLFGIPNLPIQKTDVVIFGGNNYRKGVLNGEFAVVNKSSDSVISRVVRLKGKDPVTLVWREVEFLVPNNNGVDSVVSGKILENFLYGDNFLKPDESQALYVDFIQRNKELTRGTEEFKDAILNDDFFNCLLVKFGYSITCHKAQGGEWDSVFTIWDHENSPMFNCFFHQQSKNGKTNLDFFRWAYTAITRASSKLYVLNPPNFNSYSAMTIVDLQVQKILENTAGVQNESDDLVIDEEATSVLSNYGLLDQPIQFQDHFLKTRHAVSQSLIEIKEWNKVGYEVRYKFQKGHDSAVFKVYFNGRIEFNNSFIVVPRLSQNEQLNDLVLQSLIRTNFHNVSVKRLTVNSVLEKIEFDMNFEEQFSFTKRLFDDLSFHLAKIKISVVSVDHLQYKERYSFERNGERAIFDFEYNNDGFFGRVLYISKLSNNLNLIADIQNVVLTLTNLDYAS